ncbi:hypothetical protein [Nonomuraea sp. NPDC002799]
MGLDLSRVPDIVKPLARPLAGGAIPEADVDGIIAEARTLEQLADRLAEIKAGDAGAVARMLRGGEWQGPAKEAFEKVFVELGGQPDAAGSATGEALLDLLERALREEAASLRDHGVRMQHTEWMIYAALALLGVVIVKLLVWIYVNGPAVFRAIHHRALLTRANIQMTKRLVLGNMLMFGGIMGGLDLTVQTAQQLFGDREAWDFDFASLAMSTGSGALAGALFAGANVGLSRLLSQEMVYLTSGAELAVRNRIVALGQSMYGQALMGGLAGTVGSVPGLALGGQLDSSHLAFTFLSGVVGGISVPAVARRVYLPMDAVAQLGDPSPAGPSTPSSTSPADPGTPPAGPGPRPADPGPRPADPGPRPADPSPPPADPSPPPGDPSPPLADPGPPPASRSREPELSQTVMAHVEVGAPVEPRANLPQPSAHGVIVGEVTQRHDTLLPGPVGDRAEPGAALARSQQSLPAERTPAGTITPAAETPNPGGLARSSPIPATVPAVVGATSAGADQASRQSQENAAAEPSPTRQDSPESPQRRLADDPTPHQAREPQPISHQSHEPLSASHPLRETLPAPHSPGETPAPHPLRETLPAQHSPGEAPVSQPPREGHAASQRGPQPPGPDPQPAAPPVTSHDPPNPAARQAASSAVTPRGEAPLADPAPIGAGSGQRHPSEQGQRVTDLANGPSGPVARTTTALPDGPRRIEPVPNHVADLLGRNGADEPISGTYEPIIGAARPAALRGDHSPIADPRPRTFAEAAALVHRWTPGHANDHGDSPPNRIERLLSGSPNRTGPPLRTEAEFLAEGRRLARQLSVADESDATARALASISRIIGRPDPERAIPELANELGVPFDADALVEVYNDAHRYDMAPETATDRAALTGILRRTMDADPYRWTGYRNQTTFAPMTATPSQARTIGLMIRMMGDPVTLSRGRDFVRPVLQRYGVPDVAHLLPVVRAANRNGHFPSGTTGEAAFTAGMDRFWQEDPYLWTGLLLAEHHSLPGLREPTARLTARMDEIATRPGDTVPPLERLAQAAGLGRSVDQFVRLAEEAQRQGADLARAAGPEELTDRILAYRARDPHLWDGLRIAAEHDITRPSHDEARALSRLAEITGSESPSRLWVFDPLRRLAGDAGLDHSVERLVQRTVEAQRHGFDLVGPVDRQQVLDVVAQHAGPSAGGRLPNPPDIPPGLHDLSPARVRDARQTATHELAEARQTYRENHPALRRVMSVIGSADPLAVATQERLASLEARVKAWQRWPERSEMSFTRDFAAFRNAYDQAAERAARGETVIPYLMDDVTAGLGARGGGRGFGLEIEFSLPERDAGHTLRDIGRALYGAGLTNVAEVQGYHSMKDEGYRPAKNGGLGGGWRLERDSTVAGELVSPILYDERATWETLDLALAIIRSHGGTASSHTGGHIHVSTHDYDHIVENYTSVLKHAGHHTDTLFRLGHNPERESHRGVKYAHPNVLPTTGYKSAGPVRDFHSRHDYAVNMQGMDGTSKGHVEFRWWDGSLDPAVTQAHVKVSLALVETAFRNAMLGDLPNLGRHDALGTHAGLSDPHHGLDRTEWGSLSFRILMDELFWRAVDKEQLTALYAATRWVRPA